ncbi:diguanylate cyclase, partial [Candidatus Sumerlaeota bacterium]|nr:diguanylate cyclase [Candidatus Sumerlaeota bacterium]
YRLFAQLKSDSRLKTIPIIVVTALTQDSDVEDTEWARRMGAEAFLTKPFELDDLSQRVAELAPRFV